MWADFAHFAAFAPKQLDETEQNSNSQMLTVAMCLATSIVMPIMVHTYAGRRISKVVTTGRYEVTLYNSRFLFGTKPQIIPTRFLKTKERYFTDTKKGNLILHFQNGKKEMRYFIDRNVGICNDPLTWNTLFHKT
jgi:hypothetical protein